MNETARTDAEKLNPKCRKLIVGIRETSEVTFYPISAAYQLQMTELIASAWNSIAVMAQGNENKAISNLVVAKGISEAISKNAALIFTAATCGEHKGEELLDKMDLEQFADALDIITEMNYMGLTKKLPTLIGKWKAVFMKGTPVPEVSDTMKS